MSVHRITREQDEATFVAVRTPGPDGPAYHLARIGPDGISDALDDEFGLWVTAAPADYDYGAQTVEMDPEFATAPDGTVYRLVAIRQGGCRFQLPRYGSGLYYAATVEDFEQARGTLRARYPEEV